MDQAAWGDEVSDYDIDIKVTRQVCGDSLSIRLVQVVVEPPDYSYHRDFVSVEIFPRLLQIDCRDRTGVYDSHPWPAEWPGLSYTQIEYEADLVSLATRLAVTEWQRRQEGGR
jgi:hypothetical protein